MCQIECFNVLDTNKLAFGLEDVIVSSEYSGEGIFALKDAGLTELASRLDLKKDSLKTLRTQGKKVLLIDDDPANASLADIYINPWDQKVREQLAVALNFKL